MWATRSHFISALALCFAIGCGGSSQRDSSGTDRGGSSQGGTSGSSSGGSSGSATGGTTEPPIDCGPGACSFNGSCYVEGVSPQPAGDGCNTCTCREGVAVCTDEPCDLHGASCFFNDTEYPSGSLFPMRCNSCVCIDGMPRNCTTAICPEVELRCQDTTHCHMGQTCLTSTCGATGTCVYVNAATCPSAGDTACDCIGVTTGSRCSAQAQTGSFAHTGACSGRSCAVEGGMAEDGSAWVADDGCNACKCVDGEVFCTDRSCTPCGEGLAPCADDEYCAFEYLECGSNGPGVCTLRPNGSCQIEAGSVCGCDGQLYSNYCFAAKAGQSIAAIGGCPLLSEGVPP